MKGKLERLISSRLVQHGIFWAFSLYVLLRLQAYGPDLSRLDFIYTGLFHISLLVVVYLNTGFFIPYLFNRKKYFAYGLSAIALVFLGVLIHQLTFSHLSDMVAPSYYFVPSTLRLLVQYMVIYVALSTLLYLSKSWFRLQYMEKKLREVEREKIQTELNALKAQLNPHFLMNSLNNVYGMALEKHPETPKAILQLSQALQYILYQTKGPLVPLEHELEFIRKYFELAKLRTTFPEYIQMTVSGDAEKKRVPPLLVLPLVENAIKHGLKALASGGMVQLDCEIRKDQCDITVKNTFEKPLDRTHDEKPGGLGLQNLRKRLDLLFGDRAALRIKTVKNEYIAQLQIPLDETALPFGG